jgi:O6-methylguanine-DNA--protein-cysteine methyltransferase
VCESESRKMANKAVVGAVAIDLSGYVVMERLKDWAVERERKNQEQAQRDYEAEMERRIEEKMLKQGNRSAQDPMSGIATDLLIEKEFQMKVYSHLEEMLFGLTVKVGEEGARLHDRNLHMLNLPLMSNEYDKEDLMLAVAFA